MPVTAIPQYGTRGLGVTIDRYTVLIVSDQIVITADNEVVVDRSIPRLGYLLMNARALRLGWGVLPAGDEVLYIYDRAAHNFGYTLNVFDDRCSEWGYAPFPCDQCAKHAAKGGDA